jgi:hypothetical protein
MGKVSAKLFFILLASGMIFSLAGCLTTSSSQLTSLQRRVMESKELEGSFDDAFRATVAVLQDKGYAIKTSDHSGGLIYAESAITNVPDYMFGMGSYQYRITANFEKFTAKRTKIRLSISTEVIPLPIIDLGNIKPGPVEDPQVYQELYAEIQKEMFRRAQLNK